jgi:hypothetical protein
MSARPPRSQSSATTLSLSPARAAEVDRSIITSSTRTADVTSGTCSRAVSRSSGSSRGTSPTSASESHPAAVETSAATSDTSASTNAYEHMRAEVEVEAEAEAEMEVEVTGALCVSAGLAAAGGAREPMALCMSAASMPRLLPAEMA